MDHDMRMMVVVMLVLLAAVAPAVAEEQELNWFVSRSSGTHDLRSPCPGNVCCNM